MSQQRQKELRQLELAAAEEERKQREAIEEVQKKKEVIEKKTEEIHKEIEEEKQRTHQQIEIEKKVMEAQLDREMQAIQKSTKTSFKKLAPIHNYLRTKSKLYYVWHLNPYSSSLHFGALLFFVATSVYFLQAIYPAMYQKALADALTCNWIGGTDTSWETTANWSCGRAPTYEDTITFTTAPTFDLVMTSSKDVAGVSSSGTFNKTFDTNYYNLTVNGNFIWQKGTLAFSGMSEIEVSGNFELLSAAGFYANNSIVKLTGGNTTLNSQKSFYQLIVNKNEPSNTLTLIPATTTVTGAFDLRRGTLNENILSSTGSYTIGPNANGGTTTVNATGQIIGGGGTATNITNTSGNVAWEGSASIKHLNVTSGTLHMRTGKVIVPYDDAQGKISCSSGTTLNLQGYFSGGGDLLILRSDQAGSRWSLDKDPACTIATTSDYVDLKDAEITNDTSATVTIAHGIDSGNNSAQWSITEIPSINRWLGGVTEHETEWNQAGNWSLGHTPASGEYVLFDANSSYDCVLGANVSVFSVISNDYTHTLSTNNFAFTQSYPGGFFWASGTFNGGSSSQTNISYLNLLGGVFNATSGKTQVNRAYNFLGGVFNHNGGTFSNNTNMTLAPVCISDNINFYDYLSDDGGQTFKGNASITVLHKFIGSGGSIYGKIYALGSIEIIEGIGGAGPLMITGTDDKSFTVPANKSMIGFVLNNPNTTITMGGGSQSIYSGSTIALLSGTFNASSGTLRVYHGKFVKASENAFFNHGNGTFSYETYSADWIFRPSITFYNLTMSGADSRGPMLYGTAIIENDFVINEGFIRSSSVSSQYKVRGDVIINPNADSYDGYVTLDGSGDQVYSLSGGNMSYNTTTINKTSGKVTFTGSGAIKSNINLTQGTLEFNSPGNTFTFDTGKTITTSAGTFLRFVGEDGNHTSLTSSGTWNIADSGSVYAKNVTVTNSNNSSGTIYAMDSTDGGGNTGWDFTESICNWQGGASGVWNSDANWDCSHTPDSNDHVIINSSTANTTVTTTDDISFGALTIGNGTTATSYTNKLTIGGASPPYSNKIANGGDITIGAKGTLTQSNNWDETLAIGGDLTITGADADNKGTLNHGDNSTAETWRVNMTIAGDTTVDTWGEVNVEALGYDPGYGPGKGRCSGGYDYNQCDGGSYGGMGGYGGNGTYSTGITYGSVSRPENLGSPGCEPGGGAVKLTVMGSSTINGSVLAKANESAANSGSGGSGGSVYIKTNVLSGSGVVSAVGGKRLGYNSGGGGGRIAVELTGSEDFGLISYLASGNTGSWASRIGGAGTIYKKTPSSVYGSVEVKNANRFNAYAGTKIPTQNMCPLWDTNCYHWRFDSITVDQGGDLQVRAGGELTLENDDLSSGNGTIAGSITYRGGTLNLPQDFTISKSTFNVDAPNSGETQNSLPNVINLTVAADGALSHSANPVVADINKMNLLIPGNLIVDGTINVVAKGYWSSGPGRVSGADVPSYGGKGGENYPEKVYSGPTYGSLTNPRHLGTGGWSPAGGAIIIEVGGNTEVNGQINASANATPLSDYSPGSGGTVNLTTSTISGSGTILANGGDNYTTGGRSPASGGGRIAVILTSGDSFDSIIFSARGGVNTGHAKYHGSAGTIYKKTPADNGVVVINNNEKVINPYYSDPYATLCGEGVNYDANCGSALQFDTLILNGRGDLALTNNQTLSISGNVTVAANSELSFLTDNDGDPEAGAWPTLDIAGDLTNSGIISSNAKGYPATLGYSNGEGTGSTLGGGGGFGGNGGNSAGDGQGGSSYGSKTDTNYIGSGGGLSTGGAGGGHIHIKVDGELSNNTATSVIRSNGGNGTAGGGGGSGGGILIETTDLTCNTTGATIEANGGNGDSTGGGGGGAGRIMAVVTGTRTITNCTVRSNGGNGGTGAESGTNTDPNIQSSPIGPTPVSPTAGETDVSQETAFTFSTTDPDNDYLRYKLELADDVGFSINLRTFAQTSGSQTVSDLETGTLMGDFSDQDSQGGTAYASGTTATFTISPSTPLIEGHTYYWRVSANDPEGVDNYDGNGPYYGATSTIRSFTVASINRTTYTAGEAQTLNAGECSSILTFETQNSHTPPETVKLLSNKTFTLSDDSGTGDFYSDAGCSTPLTNDQVTISQGSSSASFYYKTTTTTYADHTYAIAVSETPAEDPDWSDATTNIEVNPDSLHHFTLTGYNPSYTADQQFNITLTAYDQYNNIKFDYYGNDASVWFTSSCTSDLPYTTGSSYTFLSGDQGTKQFLNFRLKVVGNQTITLHHTAYPSDSITEDQLSITTSSITINPGAVSRFELTDYPRKLPNFSKYAVSTHYWGSTDYASEDFDMIVTVRDQFNNIVTGYDGEIWFTLYTGAGQEADSSSFYWRSSNKYAFDPQTNQGIAQTNGISGDYSYFSTATSGTDLDLRITDGTVTTQGAYTIYIKPLGISYFDLLTSDTLSDSGVTNVQDVDEEWDSDETPVSVTVIARDTSSQIKTNYAYDADDDEHLEGEGYIYFYSDERPSFTAPNTLKQNQEFPYQKTASTDSTSCFAFPWSSNGAHTFNLSEEPELFKFFRGGRRTIGVAECITPDSVYATTKEKKDPRFPDDTWNSRPNSVATGSIPIDTTIAVRTHAPGTAHSDDSHSDSSSLVTAGPGDGKATLSWRVPFDMPAYSSDTASKFYIERAIYDNPSETCGAFSQVSTPNYNNNPLSQSQVITGLTNNTTYCFKIRSGYKKTPSDPTIIYSDYSGVVTATPKELAPINVTASQLSYDPTDDPLTSGNDSEHPGEVKVTYDLRFSGEISFEYFDMELFQADPSHPEDAWLPIADSAVSGDKGAKSGNYEHPENCDYTAYLEMNTDYNGKYRNGDFNIRVKIDNGEDIATSEPDLGSFRLDTKNPHNTSLIINATNNSTADLIINAQDDSTPMRMMISTQESFEGANWEAYQTSKTDFNIEGADTVYIRFMDNYFNVTEISTEIRNKLEDFALKDGSNITKGDYRLLLMWHRADNAVHYNIWRSEDGVNYSQIREVTDNAFINIDLESDKTYAYKVTSEDSYGNISLPAGPLSSKPGSAPDVTALPQVELFGWRQDRGVMAQITWDTDQIANTNVAYSKGELNVGSDMSTKDGSSVQIAANPEMTTSHEIEIMNLEPSSTYYFKAYSINEIQIAGYSQVLSFTTPERIPLLIQGMEIGDITINSAIVTWATSKLSTTILEYTSTPIAGDATPDGAKIITDSNMNTDHSFKIDNLSSGTKYYLRAKNTDLDGNTTVSDVYTFQTPALPQVSDIAVKEISYNTATITWTTNVNADSNVEYASQSPITKIQDTNNSSTSLTTSNQSSNTNNQTEGTETLTSTPNSGMQGKNDSTTIHSVTLIGLTPKTSYTYKVLSKDQFGNLAQSPSSTFTTATDTQSPKILNLKSEVASTGSGETIKYQAIISWDTDEPATSQIEFAQGIGGDYTDKTQEVNSLNSSHVVILPDLKANSAYHFRIVSKDLVGNTAYSDDISLITPPKEKSLLQVIIKSLEDTFSWVGRLKEKWGR